MFHLLSKHATKKRRIYLDYAAATPVRREIRKLIYELSRVDFANPSAIHKEGQHAHAELESARLKIARCLKIRPHGVVFTGSGTESNNLALYGTLRQLHDKGKAFSDMVVISTKIEHPSVSMVLQHLTDLGVTVKYVSVDEMGLIDVSDLEQLLTESVVLVTFAYVNSEIGVVQNVNRISRLVKKYNTKHSTAIRVHVDAAQAPLWLPCQFDRLGVDLLSLDAGKCYGPKGVGMLAMRNDIEIAPIILGGGQEHGLRAATENLPGIVGAVESITLAQAEYQSRAEAVTALRDATIKKLAEIDGLVLNGPKEERVANNINVSISGVDSEFLVVSLDEAGIAVSTKSACSGSAGGGSEVIQAISGDVERASSTLRVTLGEETTARDLDHFVLVLKVLVQKIRAAQKRFTD